MSRHLAAVFLILAAPARLRAQDVFGPGTPDTSGLVPVLSCNQAWMGNSAFAYSISNALGGATAYFALSFQSANFPAGGVQVNVSWLPADFIFLGAFPLSGPAGVPGAGAATFPIPLTFAPVTSLAGLNFFSQAYVDDPSIPLAPLAASRGLRADLTLPPLVFVGTSVAGSTDPYRIIDPLTATVLNAGGGSFTNNVTYATFAHGGLDLYISKSSGASLTRADLSGATPQWSVFSTSIAACTGAFHDWKNDRIYTLTGPSPTSREIVGIDSNPASPAFGQAVATTTGLSSAYLDRWALSRSCLRVAVPALLGPAGNLLIVDTDPASAAYMQTILTTPIPINAPGSLTYAAAAGFTPDDETALIAIGGSSSELARYHIPSGTWLDADPSTPQTENVSLPGPPNRMDVSKDGGFAFVTSTAGTAVRVDFGAVFPYPATLTSFLAGTGLLQSAYGAALSRDDRMASITSLTPSKLLIVDTASGALLANVPLTGLANIYTSCWR